MKYEQAFYTWGKNQLSRYKEGLGICASSNLSVDFLDDCTNVGAKFSAEGSEKTAEFTMYSPEFKCFIGVGISPKRTLGDVRINRLCHLFIPKQEEGRQRPEDYLVGYPFSREIEEGTTLDCVEVPSASFDYKEIVEKYALYDERKLAELLYQVYSMIFEEYQTLTIRLDRSIFSYESDAQIARDITWLLTNLVPQLGQDPDYYIKRLSYGVYTEANAAQAHLLFTDRSGMTERSFELGTRSEEDINIPEIFYEMAKRGKNDWKSLQSFLKNVLECGVQKKEKLRIDTLQLFYLRWKLNENEYSVAIEELEPYLNAISNQARESKWHKQFLIDFILQIKEKLKVQTLVKFWVELALPELRKISAFSKEKFDEQKDFIDEIVKVTATLSSAMYNIDRKNYRLFVERDIPQIMKPSIFQRLYENENCIQDEISKIEDVRGLFEFFSRYEMFENENFIAEVICKAKDIYENSERGVKKQISDHMLKLNPSVWEEFIYSGCKIIELREYVEFLKNNQENLEKRCVGYYYQELINRANQQLIKARENEKENVDNILMELKEGRKALSFSEYEILARDQTAFQQVLLQLEIVKQMREIQRSTLDELLDYELDGLSGACKIIWGRTICKKISQDNSKPLHFMRMLEKTKEVFSAFFDVDVEQQAVKKEYENKVWNNYCGNIEGRINFQCYYQINKLAMQSPCHNFWKFQNEIRNVDEGISFEEIELEYEKIYHVLAQNPAYEILRREALKEDVEITQERMLYLLWEKIKNEEELSLEDVSFFRTRYSVDCLKKFAGQILEGIHASENVQNVKLAVNYLCIQQWVERFHNSKEKTLVERMQKLEKRQARKKAVEYYIYTVRTNECPSRETYIRKEWETIQMFFWLKDYPEVKLENLHQITQCINVLPEEFGKLPEYKYLYHDCEMILGNLKCLHGKVVKRMEKINELIDRADSDIKKLQEQLASIIVTRNNLFDIGRKMSGEIKNIEESYNGASSDLGKCDRIFSDETIYKIYK